MGLMRTSERYWWLPVWWALMLLLMLVGAGCGKPVKDPLNQPATLTLKTLPAGTEIPCTSVEIKGGREWTCSGRPDEDILQVPDRQHVVGGPPQDAILQVPNMIEVSTCDKKFAVLYADKKMTTPLPNPFLANADGSYTFASPSKCFVVKPWRNR